MTRQPKTINLTLAEADNITDAMIDAMAAIDSDSHSYAVLEAASVILHRKSTNT